MSEATLLARPLHLCRIYNNEDRLASHSYAPVHYISEARRIQMVQRLSALAFVLASAAVRAWTSFVDSLRALITVDVRTYRPEAYYMRGPGRSGARSISRERASV